MIRLILATAVAVFLVASQGAKADRVTCYFSSWAVYRVGAGKFDVEDIDPFLCTHLIFGFAGVQNDTYEIEVLDPWNENCPDDIPTGGMCAYDRFTALKQQNPDLVTTIGVGGWNEGGAIFSQMAREDTRRATFIQSSIDLIHLHGFDGMDLDWEYPTERGGIPEDYDNYVLLLRDLRAAFDAESPPLTLTAAVAAGKDKIDSGYNVPAVCYYLDAVHIMSYDFHGTWETVTGHNAPLCGYPNETDLNQYYRVDYSATYWTSLGCPVEKLVLGIAAYGRCWTLDDVNNHGYNAPASNPAPKGPYTGTPGTLDNNEICERMLSVECTIVHDENLQEPYFYCPSDGVWCGYDDEDSATKKARWAKNHGLMGVLVWTIDEDDFIPTCASVPFPVIEDIKTAVNTPADADPFRSTTIVVTACKYPPCDYEAFLLASVVFEGS